jgi:hypothetical protein
LAAEPFTAPLSADGTLDRKQKKQSSRGEIFWTVELRPKITLPTSPGVSMFEIKFDMHDFINQAKHFGDFADQVPFVVSQLLNDGAFKTRQVLIEQMWPQSVTVRNTRFLSAALHINKSTKSNLRVEIVDTLGHGHLKMHDVGGTKTVARGRIAIPNPDAIKLGAHGVPQGQRPHAIIARTPARALRITSRGIFVGDSGRLRLLYSLTPQAKINPDVPFSETFEYVMRESVRTGFADAMRRAIATRRR